MWDTRDGTVIRDLLTNITGVWQVVFDERFCVAASNAQEHTFLDVWDFGTEGDDDIEAARVGEEDEESEDEDEHEDEMMQDAASTSQYIDSVTVSGDNEDEVTEHSQQQTWSTWGPATGEDVQGSHLGFDAHGAEPLHTYGASPSLEIADPASPTPVAGPSVGPTRRSASSKDKGKGKAVVVTTPTHETPPSSIATQAMPPGGFLGWTQGAAPSAQTIAAAMTEETPSKPRSTRQRR